MNLGHHNFGIGDRIVIRRAVILFALCVVTLTATLATAQDFSLGVGRLVSPGDLSKSHTDWNAITECVRCHNLSGGINDEKCLECHKELSARVSAKKGYHASKPVVEKTCASCHHDHKGGSYYMIVWEKGRRDLFGHNLTGYDLRDKHESVKCEKCHDKKTTKGSQTFLGLTETCSACHRDIHANTLGDKCDQCHINERSFVGQDVRFDHNTQAKYKIEGKHGRVACDKCHAGNTKDRALFKVAKYDTCASCHAKADPHKGKLGSDCEKCHTVADWKKVSSFDHSRTRYRLEGKHRNADCADCHANAKRGDYKVERYDACAGAGCHDTARRGFTTHGKQFTGRRCDECHTVNGWAPATFTHEDRKYDGFKLKGKHADLKCNECHSKNFFGMVVFKPIESKQCNSSGCHDSQSRGAIHGSQFGDKDCSSCHNERGWKPVAFDHDRTRYKLHGKHTKVDCAKCHKPSKMKGTTYHAKWFPETLYRPIETNSCDTAACHSDPHKGIFKPRECVDCHTINEWKDMSAEFDHGLDTSFPLTGKHAAAKCYSCHIVAEKLSWKPLDKSCFDCHRKDDKHRGALGKLCVDCHHTTSWEAKAVAHEATGFPLTETHAQLVCVDCHTKGGGDFTGLTRDCQQCHTDPHLNQMGRFCNDCHTMRNWEPTRFSHNMTGLRLEGAHRFVDCQDCHQHRIYRVTKNDCFGCHKELFFRYSTFHSPSNTDCRQCHTAYGFGSGLRGWTHATMTFTGAHSAIKGDCIKCHTSSAGGQLKYPSAKFESDCVACHKADYNRQHRTCPQTCSLCHNTSSFNGASSGVSCQ